MTVEVLKAYGADTEEGLKRCMGNEAMYLKLVAMIPNEKNFEKLEAALEVGDLDTAFEAAHALKGVLGNLSITPLYDKTVEITELLRSRTQMDYTPLLSEILSKKEELSSLL